MADSTSHASPLELDSGGSSQEDSASETASLRTYSATSSIYKYRYEDGRRYHFDQAYDEGRYLLPNDETEQDRLDLQHFLFRLTLDGALYRAPLPENVHNVLDVGTGTGIWAMEFAEEHPKANVLGVDLSPIQPTSVPPNCAFRVDNIEADWMPDEKYDFIHSRAMIGGFKDWPRFFTQAFEHLNPGGYLELQDLCFPTHCINPTDTANSHMVSWSNHGLTAASRAGIDLKAPLSWPDQLRNAGFQEIHLKWFNWPIGPWAKQKKNKELGRYTMANFNDAVTAPIALFTKILGWSVEEYEELVVKLREEFREQKIHLYQTVAFCYARKPLEGEKEVVSAGSNEESLKTESSTSEMTMDTT